MGNTRARRAKATDSQWNNQVTTAASASAKENTSELSPVYAEQQIAANTEASTDAPNSPGLQTLEPFDAHTDAASGVHRVSPEMAAYIVKIKRLRPEITQAEIAALVGVTQPTVSRWLAEFENDTVPEARKYLRGKALKAALLLDSHIGHSDPRVSQGAAKAITALAGVQESGQQVAVGVQVIVGQLGQPAGMDPFNGHNVMVNCDPVSD